MFKWLLTPLIAVVVTVAGVVLLFLAQTSLGWFAGDFDAICRTPDCALGVGLMLLAGAFAASCLAALVGVLVGVRFRHDPASRPAIRRGVMVSLCFLLVYLLECVVVWLVV